MRKPSYLLMFLVLVLMLAACGGGGAVEETPGLGGETLAPGGIGEETVAPGGVETLEPSGGETDLAPTEAGGAGGVDTTPSATVEETEAEEGTPTVAATAAATATTAGGAGETGATGTPSTGGTGAVVGTATPGIPVTGASQFVLVSDLLTYRVVMAGSETDTAGGTGGTGGAVTGTPEAGGTGAATGTPSAGGTTGPATGDLGTVEDIILSLGVSPMDGSQPGDTGGEATSTPSTGGTGGAATGTPSTGGTGGSATETPEAGVSGETGRRAGQVGGARVLYLVIGADESFGFGEENLVAIPWEHVQIDHANQVIEVDVTQEQFETAPTFSPDNWPDMTSPDWDQEWQDFWNQSS